MQPGYNQTHTLENRSTISSRVTVLTAIFRLVSPGQLLRGWSRPQLLVSASYKMDGTAKLHENSSAGVR